MLTALSSHYWRPDFSPGQAAAMWLDYCQDLAICRLDEIEIAIREYRLNSKNQFFPKSSVLREIVFANRKHRQELERIGPKVNAESRPIMWWTQRPYLWRSHWRVEDIPADYRATFDACLKAKRAAGAEGWGEHDFYGLERKYADRAARDANPKQAAE